MSKTEKESPAAPKKSLVTKLAEVMGEVGRIAKTGRNNFHNYDYATEADIVESVRGGMAERGLMLIPDVVKTEWREVPGKSGPQKICALTVRYTLLDGDSDQKIEFTILGEGQDQGDKATYKALTGATKYALLKLFLIPTGDDPEQDGPRQQPKQPPQQQPQGPSAGKRTTEVKAHLASRTAVSPLSPAGRAAGDPIIPQTAGRPTTNRKMPPIEVEPEWFERIRNLGSAHGYEAKKMSSFVKGVGITKTDPKSFTSQDFDRVAAALKALAAPEDPIPPNVDDSNAPWNQGGER